ncbi:MAG: DUF6268 family outer membrane beta-barrel protein [Lacipirellulaceae bacterium]
MTLVVRKLLAPLLIVAALHGPALAEAPERASHWLDGAPIEGATLDEAILAPRNAVEGPEWQSAGEVRLAQSSDFANEATAPAQQTDAVPPLSQPPLPAEDRSVWQGMELEGTWVPQLEEDGLGESDLSATIKLGLPMPLIGGPLLVSPRYGLHLLDGPPGDQLPAGYDVPPRLHDLEVGFMTFRELGERWLLNVGVTVGVYGDDASLDTGEALGVSGMVVGIYKQSPQVQYAIGAAFLNRDDLPVVPAVGVIYDTGAVKYELMMPRPRIVWRLDPAEANGAAGQGVQRAIYLGGELGGGAWAVQRLDGSTDRMNVSRFGLVLGWEAKGPGRGSRNFEIGYLFDREIEFTDLEETEVDLDNSLIARVGVSF